ncbi:TlpA disulfide reductase family protein [Flavobacterium antarcticum]|uniref:TlpA family protein disulfide reductase n=1 Tax=Flavobacterium antarcticum TaxID=271155 RepID=UPI0003B40474|nr:TlpA disulfide reductase family protein [Flavobacterium antarcticum]
MKKIAITFLATIGFFSAQAQVDYAIISGKIENPTADKKIRLYDSAAGKSAMLNVGADGSFRDTIHLKTPTIYTTSYDSFFSLYVENGMDVQVSFDAKKFKSTLKYEGKGSLENQVLFEKEKFTNELFGEDYRTLFSLDKPTFTSKLNEYNSKIVHLLESNKKNLSANFISMQSKAQEEFMTGMTAENTKQLQINEKLIVGKPSPSFKNYESQNGKKVSLSDLRGKYVFIDVWATWCGPCKYEFPYIKELEKKYHGKNITFLSISVDRQKDKEKWKKMIVKEGLGGVQLLADNEIESQFIKDYFIEGIPRFILLDPQGNLISYDTPRPSEPELITLFDEHGI